MSRAPSAALAGVLALGLGACQALTARLDREIFAAPLELTMDRHSDLQPPEGLRVLSTEQRSISLAWNPVLVGDVAGYAILRAQDPRADFALVGRSGSRFDTVWSDRGEGEEQLGDGQTYHYRVHPFDAAGQVSRSHAHVVATTEPRPDVPVGLRTFSNLPRKIVLAWEPNERRSTTGYAVLRSPTAAGPWERIGYTEGRVNTIFEDSVSGDLRVMYYRLVASNPFGGESDASEPVRGVTKAEPLPPIELRVRERRLGAIDLAWAANVERDLRWYEVWRAERADGGWGEERRIGQVDAPATRFSDTSVGCDQQVRYRLRARDRDDLVSGHSRALESVGESVGLRFERSADGQGRLSWDAGRARGWPRARVLEVYRVRPDREISQLEGASEADLGAVAPGQRTFALELARPSGSGAGSGDAPLQRCEVSIEVR